MEYKLRITENPSQSDAPSTYFFQCVPLRDGGRGVAAMVPYTSWEQLSQKLSSIKTDGEMLQKIREDLDLSGRSVIAEITLSDEQLKQLGFTDIAT